MYNGIGLHTPRGTGTSGYVEQNRAFPQRKSAETQGDRRLPQSTRRLSKALEDYDARRRIELKCYVLKKKLESSNVPRDQVEAAVDQLRAKLSPPAETPPKKQGAQTSDAQGRPEPV
jgi:serine/arginine repetitive matrix protein 2